MTVRPITLRAANAYVEQHHRHHKPARGCVFCVSVWDTDTLHGVAIVGRPLARMLQDGVTCEVTRVCTDGTRNVCSERIITYTLPEEGGASLRAAGWKCEPDWTGGGTWSREGRERENEQNTTPKLRWSA